MFARLGMAILLAAALSGNACGFDGYGLPASYSVSAAGAPYGEPLPGCEGCCLRGIDSCFSVRMEYLMWWGGGQDLPAIFTTSPDGTARADAGVLGAPGTRTLFGGGDVGENFRNGGRLTLDYLLSPACGRRIVTRFYALEDDRETFSAVSDGDPIIARPFFNVQTGNQDSLLVAFPGVATGCTAFAQTRNDFLGGDLYLQQTICDDGCHNIDWLAGYQFARLDDALFIRSVSTSIDPQGVVPVGTELGVVDHFRTQNEFHGACLGITGARRSACWRLEYLFKLGLGNMHQTAIVEGRTTTAAPEVPVVASAGGLLAQPTNIGSLSRDRFVVIPEVNLNLGYQVDERWSLLLGYSFLYFPNVALAGSQIDTTLNLSQVGGPLVGPARPAPRLESDHYWLQGLSLGAEYRF